MRTGPFSEPTVVTLINRYFVPVHVDNQDWSEPRYGIKPGEENAYILLETPPGQSEPPDVVFLKTLSQVLEPETTRAELLSFLEVHPEFHQPWPELEELDGNSDPSSRTRRAELLVEEGKAEQALELLKAPGLRKQGEQAKRAALIRASAYRYLERVDEAAAELDGAPETLEVSLERIRLAFDRGLHSQAAKALDELLSQHRSNPKAAEAYYLRGWLYHLEGDGDRAVEVWSDGIERHPPTSSLFSQKAYLTLIRANWELPDNVDQAR